MAFVLSGTEKGKRETSSPVLALNAPVTFAEMLVPEQKAGMCQPGRLEYQGGERPPDMKCDRGRSRAGGAHLGGPSAP